ncbi:MAG: FliG C-terminal domain-containing protein [Pseudomonadota bacterium]
MSVIKQRDLQRFKKTRLGLVEFACILEQATPKVRDKIITEVGSLDPSFLRTALKKVVYFEEIIYLDESTLAELLSHISPRVLAFSLFGMSPEFCKSILNTLDFRKMRQVQEEQENLGKCSQGLVFGSQIQILKYARELEAKNKFVFELLDCPRFKVKSKKHLRLVGSK